MRIKRTGLALGVMVSAGLWMVGFGAARADAAAVTLSDQVLRGTDGVSYDRNLRGSEDGEYGGDGGDGTAAYRADGGGSLLIINSRFVGGDGGEGVSRPGGDEDGNLVWLGGAGGRGGAGLDVAGATLTVQSGDFVGGAGGEGDAEGDGAKGEGLLVRAGSTAQVFGGSFEFHNSYYPHRDTAVRVTGGSSLTFHGSSYELETWYDDGDGDFGFQYADLEFGQTFTSGTHTIRAALSNNDAPTLITFSVGDNSLVTLAAVPEPSAVMVGGAIASFALLRGRHR